MKNSKKILERSEVTIIIPTFNRSDYLQKAIDTSLSQTYPCHIIVCDHGSKDDTPEIMQKYQGRVQYLRKEEDFGPHFGWLDGAIHAKTKYIKILYDDDWIDPTFVEKTLELMTEDVSCVISNALISHENGEEKGTSKSTFFNKTGVFRNTRIKMDLLLFRTVISPTCCLFRKEEVIDGIYQGRLFKNGGNYYHGVGPDMFIMLLGFLRYKKIGLINEYLATFRAHEKSISMDANKKNENKIKIQKAYSDVIEFYLFLSSFKIYEILVILPLRLIRNILLKIKTPIIKIIRIMKADA